MFAVSLRLLLECQIYQITMLEFIIGKCFFFVHQNALLQSAILEEIEGKDVLNGIFILNLKEQYLLAAKA